MPDIIVYNTPIVNKEYKGKRIDKYLTECFSDISVERHTTFHYLPLKMGKKKWKMFQYDI